MPVTLALDCFKEGRIILSYMKTVIAPVCQAPLGVPRRVTEGFNYFSCSMCLLCNLFTPKSIVGRCIEQRTVHGKGPSAHLLFVLLVLPASAFFKATEQCYGRIHHAVDRPRLMPRCRAGFHIPREPNLAGPPIREFLLPAQSPMSTV